MWGDIAIAFLLAFITAFVITPYTIRLAKKVGAVDVPDDNRRINKKPMPRLGGLAVILGFIVSMVYLIISMFAEGKIDFLSDNLYIKLISTFIGILIIGVTCYIDDVKGLNAFVKLIAQIAAAVIVVRSGIIIDNITIQENNVILNEIFSYILTIGWIVGITNAINLIDGLDGLSSGISLISSFGK